MLEMQLVSIVLIPCVLNLYLLPSYLFIVVSLNIGTTRCDDIEKRGPQVILVSKEQLLEFHHVAERLL